MAHNVQRIPAAASLYGAGYVPIANYAANTAALAALQKNAAMAATAYGGYAGYAMPQAFPAAAFPLPIHDIYQSYWNRGSDRVIQWLNLNSICPRHKNIFWTWSLMGYVANTKTARLGQNYGLVFSISCCHPLYIPGLERGAALLDSVTVLFSECCNTLQMLPLQQ